MRRFNLADGSGSQSGSHDRKHVNPLRRGGGGDICHGLQLGRQAPSPIGYCASRCQLAGNRVVGLAASIIVIGLADDVNTDGTENIGLKGCN